MKRTLCSALKVFRIWKKCPGIGLLLLLSWLLCSCQTTTLNTSGKGGDALLSAAILPMEKSAFSVGRSVPMISLGHQGSLLAVTFSADGQLAYSLGQDQIIRIWEVANGREVRNIKMASDQVMALAASHQKPLLASGEENGQKIAIRNINTGQVQYTFPGHTRQIRSLVFSPDDALLASGSSDKNIKLWDMRSKTLRSTLRAHSAPVNALAFSGDGKWLASVGDDRRLIVWNSQTGKLLFQQQAHPGAVRAVAFSPDNHYLATGGDNILIVWDWQQQKPLFTLNSHTQGINSLAFSPDSKMLVSGSDDHSIKLWDVSKGKEIGHFKGHTDKVISVAFSPNGRFVLSGSADKTLRLWGTKFQNPIREFSGDVTYANVMGLYPEQKLLLAGYQDGTLKLWNTQNGKVLRVLSDYSEAISSLAVVTGNPEQAIAISGSVDGFIRLWDLSLENPLATISAHQGAVTQLLMSKDKKFLLSAGADKDIHLWRYVTRLEGRIILQKIRTYRGHTRLVTALAFSPDGRFFISASRDNTLRRWSLQEQDKAQGSLLLCTEYPVNSLDISVDGKWLVFAAWQIQLLNLQDNSLDQRFVQHASSHQSAISVVRFSSDAKKIISAGWDQYLKLWDLESGSLQKQWKNHQAGITDALIVPFRKGAKDVLDNIRLYSSSIDGSIHIQEAGQKQETLRLLASDKGEWLSMTPDGYYQHSPEGSTLIHWVAKNSPKSFAFEQFSGVFNKPDIIQQRLSGNLQAAYPPPPFRQPPQLFMLGHQTTRQTCKDYWPVKIRLKRHQRVKNIRLFVNGMEVVKRKVRALEEKLQIDVPLFAGENRITAIAFDEWGFSSDPRFLNVVSHTPKKQQGDLYILAVGIDNYSSSEVTPLQYAVSDAQLFVNNFKKQEHKLYRQVHVILLQNHQVQAERMREILDELSKKIRRNDMFMLFMAGHGVRDEQDNFYFLSSHSSIENESLKKTAIHWSGLEKSLKKIKARTLLFLDACHSASIHRRTIVPNDRLARQLVSGQQGGIMVFSAAKGRQYALEGYAGKGLFSFALDQALNAKTSLADTNANGFIEFMELVAYVEKYVNKVSYGHQTPWLSSRGLFGDFPVAVRSQSGNSGSTGKESKMQCPQ